MKRVVALLVFAVMSVAITNVVYGATTREEMPIPAPPRTLGG